MGNCFLHGNRGNIQQNYRVKTYRTEELLDADTPYENTIGVVTDVDMTGYFFQRSYPGDMASYLGKVWFETTDVSGLNFTPMKNNSITIHLKSCRQCQTSFTDTVSWNERTSKIFMDGKWYPLKNIIFDFGKTPYGWSGKRVKKLETDADDKVSAPKVKEAYLDSSNRYTNDDSCGGILITDTKVDLRKYKTLIFEGTMKSSSTEETDNCALYLWREEPTKAYSTSGFPEGVIGCHFGENGLRLDISNLDYECYIGFGIYDDSSEVLLRSLRLEPAQREGELVDK